MPNLQSQVTESSSAVWSSCSPPANLVSGHSLPMCRTVCVLPCTQDTFCMLQSCRVAALLITANRLVHLCSFAAIVLVLGSCVGTGNQTLCALVHCSFSMCDIVCLQPHAHNRSSCPSYVESLHNDHCQTGCNSCCTSRSLLVLSPSLSFCQLCNENSSYWCKMVGQLSNVFCSYLCFGQKWR